MLRTKQITALFVIATVLIFGALPVMAAELSVKENRTKSGIVNVTVPYISGSVGGKNIDSIVNQAVFSYVNSLMKQVLSQQEIAAFDSTHKEQELSDVLHYNSDLVKYTDRMIANKNTAGRVTASWYIHSEYEVKAARDTFFSVILKTKTYLGGRRNMIVWKAMNFDLKDGHLIELKELFDAEADYATRLQTLIGYQQKGRARLIRHIKGKNVAEPQPVTITGQENFYVDDHYNLGIILYSKARETATVTGEEKATPSDSVTAAEKDKAITTDTSGEGNETQTVVNQEDGSVKMEIYDISLNDFADLIKL